jgi:hypothetical protein
MIRFTEGALVIIWLRFGDIACDGTGPESVGRIAVVLVGFGAASRSAGITSGMATPGTSRGGPHSYACCKDCTKGKA